MTEISVVNKNVPNTNFDDFHTAPDSERHHWNSLYIRNQLHEKKIDEFFWTDINAPKKRTSPLALIGSLAGVAIPTLLIGRKHNPKLKLNSLKNIFKTIDVHYGLKEILIVGLGGLFGGLAGGLADRKEPKKLEKIQEGTFQLMNITFPAVLVAGANKLCEKSKAFNKPAIKIAASAIGMLAGAALAVNLANKVDNKLFDKYNIEPDRKFKKKDFIVHIDDVVGALILAKIPIAEKLHINKILPLIFAWSGFHVGEK